MIALLSAVFRCCAVLEGCWDSIDSESSEKTAFLQELKRCVNSCRPYGTRSAFRTYPRTYVRGYHIPSLSGLECGCVPDRHQNSVFPHTPKPSFLWILYAVRSASLCAGCESLFFHVKAPHSRVLRSM